MGVLVLTALVVGFILLHRRKRDAKTQPAYFTRKRILGHRSWSQRKQRTFERLDSTVKIYWFNQERS
jgi:hypothetical protein